MKLIALNLWGGIVYEPLIEFITKHSDVDIFCFQEMLFGTEQTVTEIYKARVNLFEEIKTILPDFIPHTHLSSSKHFQDETVNFPVGQAIFVRKTITTVDEGGFVCYEETPEGMLEGGNVTGNVEWVSLDGETTILNLHGIWQKNTGKKDTPERITQSKVVKDFLDSQKGRKILCGDFNLNPDGQSIAILEEGMRNLISEYNITSTRSSHYKKGSKFADYILVSPDVEVVDFKVFQDEVSDHLPLYLEFN